MCLSICHKTLPYRTSLTIFLKIQNLILILYSAGPFKGIMRKGCTLISNKIWSKYSQWRSFSESKPVPCTNSFKKKRLSILVNCMANLSKFHVVFSSSTLIRLDKDAFEGHLCQTVNNFVKHNESSLLSPLRKRHPPQHIKHIRKTRVSRIPTFDEPSQIAQQRWTYVVYRWLNTGKVERCLQRLSIQEPLLYSGAPSRGVDSIRERHLVKIISTTFFVSIHTCLMDNIFYYVSLLSVSVSISFR